MSKRNRKRKGKTNEEVLKSVFGKNYVSPYSETAPKKSDFNSKWDPSSIQRAPTTTSSARKKISVLPVSFTNDVNCSTPASNELKNKPNITTHLPINVQQVSSLENPVSVKQQKLPSDVPMSTDTPCKEIKKLLHIVQQFSPCDKLQIDFLNEQFVINKNGMYHLFNFKGEKILSYTFNGKYINSK